MNSVRSKKKSYLYGIGTDHRNEVAVVVPPRFSIGRAKECSRVISNIAVSRLHCSFQYDGTSWTLTDHSLCGTYINGRKVPKGVFVPLDEGSVVKLGPHPNYIYIFSFRDREDLEPVLSRLALRMQTTEDDDDVRIISTYPPANAPGTVHPSTLAAHTSAHAPVLTSVPAQQETGPALDRSYELFEINGRNTVTPLCHASSVVHYSGTHVNLKRPWNEVVQAIDNGMENFHNISGVYAHHRPDVIMQSSGVPESMCPISLPGASKRLRMNYDAYSGNSSSPYADNHLANRQNDDLAGVSYLSNATPSDIHLKNEVIYLKRRILEQERNQSLLLQKNQELQSKLLLAYDNGFDGFNDIPSEAERLHVEGKGREVRLPLTHTLNPERNINYSSSQLIEIPTVQQAMGRHDGAENQANGRAPRAESLVEKPQSENERHCSPLKLQYDGLMKIQAELEFVRAKRVDLENMLAETRNMKNSMTSELELKNAELTEIKKELVVASEAKTSLNECLKVSEEKLNNMSSLIENELQCSICSEIFITPIMLQCRHTFCEFCVIEWKKKKSDCPMCRTPITTETRSIALESFIEKYFDLMMTDVKEHRQVVVTQRREHIRNSAAEAEVAEVAEVYEISLEEDEEDDISSDSEDETSHDFNGLLHDQISQLLGYFGTA